MAAWIRDGEAPDEVKVSFVVNKADHPELVDWLWGLPFRQQSAVIRTVLSEAAKMVATGTVLTPPAAAKPVAKANETPAASMPLSTSPAPAATVVQPSVSTPSNSGGMTEATAAILKRMQGDF